MGERPVRLPPELEEVPPRPLEDYVRARLVQFAGAFASRACPQLGPADVRAAAAAAIAQLPPPERAPGGAAGGAGGGRGGAPRELQLVFRHDCLSLGCLDPHCALCEHNPRRRCSVNFAPKYLVNDVLRAKCDAAIRVEVIDRSTGLPASPADLAGVALEVCVLDGNAYDARCVESGAEREGDLGACELLLNNRGAPLLAFGGASAAAAAGNGSSSAPAVGVGGAQHAPDGRVLVPLGRGAGGAVPLPDLHVTDSSEAMLSGRKPPFRLLVRAVYKSAGASGAPGDSGDAGADSRPPPARHAVSEGFVVATRRTRTAGKVEIPNVDDHVSKLEHMGKETVKKLQDIAGSARASGVDLGGGAGTPRALPDNCVESVGAFRRLALLAESDGHLRQKLQAVLKLSKEKWDDARDHALRAVVADSRMRIWYSPEASNGNSGDGDGNNGGGVADGLLFAARLGDVDLDRPVGVLHRRRGGAASGDGAAALEATLAAQQTPAQREAVRALRPRAAASWWQPGHPGWAIYPADSDAFLASAGAGGGGATVLGGGAGGALGAPAAVLSAPLPPAVAVDAKQQWQQPPPVSASGRPLRASAAASSSGRAAAAAEVPPLPLPSASPFARAVDVGGAALSSHQQQHYGQPSLGGPLPSFGLALPSGASLPSAAPVPLPLPTQQSQQQGGLAGVFSGALMTDIARMHSTGLEGDRNAAAAVLSMPPPPPRARGSDLPPAAAAAAAPPPPGRTPSLTPFGAVNGTPFAAGGGGGPGATAAASGANPALRAPSLGIGRLDSLDLDPDLIPGRAPSGGLAGHASATMVPGRHSGGLLPAGVAGGGALAGAPSYGVVVGSGAATAAGGAANNGAGIGRAESGLESMQSIEDALGTVGGGGRGGGGGGGGRGGGGGAEVIDRVAREWKQQQQQQQQW